MGFLDEKIRNLPNGRQIIEMPNSVNFVLITLDGNVVMAKQNRLGEDILNSFGGYIERDESVQDAMYREMEEEVNVHPKDISWIRNIYFNKLVSSGYTSERNSLYIIQLNKNYDDVDLHCNDVGENIEIYAVSTDELGKIDFSKIQSLKLFLALEYIDICGL